MNDRDLIENKRLQTKSLSFFALPNVLFGLNFGVLGGMANAFFSVSFFGSLTLYFGQFFVLLCLVMRGINSALFAVAISSLVTAIVADDPYLIIIFALEILVVHTLLHRGLFLFQSVMLYWLFIGLPLLLTLTALTVDTDIDIDVLFINALTRVINALICVSVAALFMWFLPIRLSSWKYKTRPPKLAALIFSLCVLTVTLPALLMALFFINQAAERNESAVSQAMHTNVARIAWATERLLSENLNGLETLADYIANTRSPISADNILSATQENLPSLKRISVFSSEGKLLLSTHRETTLSPRNGSNHFDSPLFQKTRSSLSQYVSDAKIDKPFSDAAVIVLSVPVVKNDSFAGVVQASISLDELDDLADRVISGKFSYVIVDKYARSLASTMVARNLLLSNFDYTPVAHPLINTLEVINTANSQYLLSEGRTKSGWSIIVLADPKLVTSPLIVNFYVLILSAVFVIIAFSIVASQLSKKITRPLEDIAENYPNKNVHPQIMEEAQVSDEIVKLTHTLISSHAVMSDFQAQLKEQVENKTRQLKQLNKELYSLAQKDGLTQLLNRSGFNRFALTSYRNCVRNRISMSMILVDIDHFKRVNDTYGHPFGDKCIKTVAKTLQKHCKRDTDIIGRFGGEEFIIMIVGGEISEHHTRIKLITDSIRKNSFNVNNQEVNITISAGICSILDDFSIDFDALIKYADEQLYLSKRTGRDKTSILVR
ncbi:sensor domain-containing diguanylate cyclase [Agaribacter flavus]|uniref:diguanylate cyclase n=1 Tax=Agaribacter flavus TaxID=1902781 RepID=A0ABV7FQN2_9ALTE